MTRLITMPYPVSDHLSAKAGFMIFFVTLISAISLGTATHLTQTYHSGLETYLVLAAVQARAAEDHLTQNRGVIDLTLLNLLENDAADPAIELARAVRHAPYLRSLSLAGPGGCIIASSNPANVGQIPSFDDSLPPFAAGGEVLRLSRPREGRDLHDGRPIPASGADPAARTFFTAVRDIIWRGATHRLVAAVNTDYFINHYARNVENQRGAVEVFRYDATLMLSTDERRRPGLIDPEAVAFHSGIPPRAEIGEFMKARLAGRPTLAAYRASRRFPLVVTVHIPREYALTEWRKDRNSVLRFVLPALVIAVVLGGVTLLYLRRVAAEYERADQATRAYQQLKTLLDTIPANLVLMGPERQVLLANQAWRQFIREIGIDTDHALDSGQTLALLPRLEDPKRAVDLGNPPPQSDSEKCIATPTGPRWFHVAMRPFHSEGIDGALVLQVDITRRHEAEQALALANQQLSEQIRENEALQALLREQAVHDPLTGLYNRRYLDEIAGRELTRARREKTPVTLAVLDIDHFKGINDRYGHQGGDRVLVELAELLRAHIRSTDIACRIGGEEFLLLLPNLPLRAAIERAERLRQAFAALPVHFDEWTLRATLSIGLAGYPDHGDTVDFLIRAADEALYEAKRRGRDRVEIAILGGFKPRKP